MAKGKVNLEFSMSVMVSSKCCIDLFFYSALRINVFNYSECKVASFPGPTQLSVTCNTEKRERA